MAGNHDHTGADCPCKYTGKVEVGGNGPKVSLTRVIGGERDDMQPPKYGGEAGRRTDLRPERQSAGTRDSNKGKK